MKSHLLELPGCGGGTHDVVAALHDGRRNVFDFVGVVQKLLVFAEKALVDEVVAETRNILNSC